VFCRRFDHRPPKNQINQINLFQATRPIEKEKQTDRNRQNTVNFSAVVYALAVLWILTIIYSNKCKKYFQFKTVCNSNTAYITQLKQQKSKSVITWQHIAIMSTGS